VSHCRELCRLTRNVVQRGDVADMLEQSLRLQCGARQARAAKREDFVFARSPNLLGQGNEVTIRDSTQLMRAALLNNLLRVRQLIQLGAPLDLVDRSDRSGVSALYRASCYGHEHVVKALLDGKYEGRGGATVDLRYDIIGATPVMLASSNGHEGVVRALLARGARQDLHGSDGWAALHWAVVAGSAGTVALLCAAPGAAAALALRDRDGKTPLALAVMFDHAECEAVLRAHGARE
jgi:ankyrin repeat protein